MAVTGPVPERLFAYRGQRLTSMQPITSRTAVNSVCYPASCGISFVPIGLGDANQNQSHWLPQGCDDSRELVR